MASEIGGGPSSSEPLVEKAGQELSEIIRRSPTQQNRKIAFVYPHAPRKLSDEPRLSFGGSQVDDLTQSYGPKGERNLDNVVTPLAERFAEDTIGFKRPQRHKERRQAQVESFEILHWNLGKDAKQFHGVCHGGIEEGDQPKICRA